MLNLRYKYCDEDFPSIQKKKSRSKKPRDKFSLMMVFPMKVLSQIEEETISGGELKRGKRFGFTVYDALTCKSCKPNKFFHKRLGLSVKSENHEKSSNFNVPSLYLKSFSLPTPTRSKRTTTGGMSVKFISDSNIEFIEIVEVKENRVKSFLPKDYR